MLRLYVDKKIEYPNNIIRTCYKIEFCDVNDNLNIGYEYSFTPLKLKVVGYATELTAKKEVDEKEI